MKYTIKGEPTPVVICELEKAVRRAAGRESTPSAPIPKEHARSR